MPTCADSQQEQKNLTFQVTLTFEATSSITTFVDIIFAIVYVMHCNSLRKPELPTPSNKKS
jgi:hypothetical protein